MNHPNANKLLQLLRDNARARADGGSSVRMETTSDTEVHVYVYDVIDPWWGANATDLVQGLQSAGNRTVHLHINSPGGDIFEARAMASAIVAYPARVITHIDGLAASAATYVALAANEVRIMAGGMMMLHNSWSLGVGDKSDMRKTADLLEQVDGLIAADYARHMGIDAAAVAVLMDAESWYTPEAALEAKLVDAVDPNTKRESAQASAARWNLSAYGNAPKPAARDPNLAERAAAQVQKNRNKLALLSHGFAFQI